MRSPGGGAPGMGCELARETRPRYSMILRAYGCKYWRGEERGKGEGRRGGGRAYPRMALALNWRRARRLLWLSS